METKMLADIIETAGVFRQPGEEIEFHHRAAQQIDRV
jgi:hypothetical protein